MIKNLLRGLTLESLAYNLSMVAKPKLKCLLRHPTIIPVRPERVTTLLHFIDVPWTSLKSTRLEREFSLNVYLRI